MAAAREQGALVHLRPTRHGRRCCRQLFAAVIWGWPTGGWVGVWALSLRAARMQAEREHERPAT